MAYDAEKQMLRELANWVLPRFNCCFCNEPMMDTRTAERQGFGHRRHTSVRELITFHHKDENRDNNSRDNVGICHPPCHKKYHRSLKLKEVLDENPAS